MKIIDAKQCAAIALGRLGENEYTVVRFDVSAWITEIPGAVIGLYNQRPGDADAYPIAAIAVEDSVATWTVTSAELTQTGEGRCELVAIAGEVVAKSAIFRTIVFDALDGSGEAPEPWEEWQQQFIILKDAAEHAADRAEEAVEHYPRINNGMWEVWDGTTEQWVSTGVQAQGPQGETGERGETGDPGPRGETGEPGVDGVTFTPSVSANGVISWTNDGSLPNPQPVNIKGPQGDDYILTAADKAEIAQQAEELLAPALDEKANMIHASAGPSDIVSISDAAAAPVDSLTAVIEPVQDLHGYDSPWPAGGGKNLYDASTYPTITKNGITCTNNGDGSFTLNGTASTDCFFDIFAPQFRGSQGGTPLPNGAYRITGCPTGGSGSTYYMYITPSYTGDYGNGNTNNDTEVSGGSIFIKNGYTCNNLVFKPMIRTASNGDDTFSPYSNICPITGWTGAKVTRTGKNLANLRLYSGGAYNPTIGSTWNLLESSAQLTDIGNGQFSVALGIWSFRVLVFDLMDGQSYRFKCRFSGVDIATTYGYLDENNTVLYKNNETGANFNKDVLFTGTSEYRKVYVGFAPRSSAQTITLTNPQLELGSTATPYEPYQGETYSITFPTEAGTVYGGELTVNEDGTGRLVVDRYFKSFTTLMGKSENANGYFWYTTSDTLGIPIISGLNAKLISNRLVTEPNVSQTSFDGRLSFYKNGIIRWKEQGSLTLQEYRTYLANNPLEICYELAEPITYTLTPQEIRTLLGTNNIWADTGDTAVTYPADTKLYIDRKITEAIAAAMNA